MVSLFKERVGQGQSPFPTRPTGALNSMRIGIEGRRGSYKTL